MYELKYASRVDHDDYFDAILGVPGKFFNPYNAIGRIARAKESNAPIPKFNKAEWGAIQKAQSAVTKVSKRVAGEIGWC